MGGRSILWNFESALDRDRFVRNRFFWDDSFVSMKNWSDSLQNFSSPVWINVSGVPLRLWNVNFFHKIGNLLGELLFIEKDTLLRKRLDRARLLIALPGNRRCPQCIRVAKGRSSWPISIEKDAFPMEFALLSEVLDLKHDFLTKGRESSPMSYGRYNDRDNRRSSSSKSNSGEKGSQDARRQPGAFDKMDKRHIGRGDYHERRKSISEEDMGNCFRTLAILKPRNLDLTVEKTKEKGKHTFVRKVKKRPTLLSSLNGKLDLEIRRDTTIAESSVDSSDSEFEEGQLKGLGRFRGECSRFKVKSTKTTDHGPQSDMEYHASPREETNPETLEISTLDCENRTRIDPLEGPRHMLVRHRTHNVVSISDKEGRLLSLPFNLPLNGPIQLHLNGAEGYQISGKDLIVLPLEIWRWICKGLWSFRLLLTKEEIAKVIEKGVALGLVFKSNDTKTAEGEKHACREQDGLSVELDNNGCHNEVTTGAVWDLGDEVAKVIEVGMSLGFDFNGKEVEIGAQIERREREDDRCMDAANNN
ncbi:hypothetical protein Dsin_023659 [Dipteronia sinensis]|uniref:DUF4283 domain-containing protein n=1 Tax=Dipteronia sinensis TaxID=43782 RepID=A0AAE0E197_9ROSI|nr:hypothetical protein Dsin_023659 [Dipteronia sinensis]